MADEITPRDGPPAKQPKYDQEFFLDLGAKGKDVWNAWRRDLANKDVRVTFAGIDFSEAPRDEIDFSGFEFGDHADFSQCKWRGVKEIPENPVIFEPGRAFFFFAAFGRFADFTGATFGNGATFMRGIFGHVARFNHAAFGDFTSFHGAVFGNGAGFKGAAFGNWTYFDGAAFVDGAKFNGAAFGNEAGFSHTAFGDGARFSGAAFGEAASFADTFFKGHVECSGKSIEQWSWDLGLNADEADEKGKVDQIALKNLHEASWKDYRSGPDRFLTISFENARFVGEADFSGRSFERAANFISAHFYSPPNFDAATNVARIDFTGAHIGFAPPGKLHWSSETKIPIRLRAFRKIAEDTKNHDLERDLYIEERKAERGVYLSQLFKERKNAPKREWPLIAGRLLAHILWIAVMGIYWVVSDYGRSFVRPAVWLVSSGFFFYWSYSEVLAKLMAKAPDIEKYKQAVRMLALGNTVPFVGPLTIHSKVKEFLFCPCRNCPDPLIPPECYQLLVLSQNLFSITCVFFIGLALRNYFKIK